MGQKRIDERMVRMAGRGMDDHAFGLIDDEEIRVLIDDRKRDLLRLHRKRRRVREHHTKALPRLHPMVFGKRGAVFCDKPLRDILFDGGARHPV